MRFVLNIMIILILISSVLGQGWINGRFIVLFEPELDLNFQSNPNDYVTTGIEEIDFLMNKYQIFKAKKLFPVATNPEYAKKRYDVRNTAMLYTRMDSLTIPKICENFRNSQYVVLSDPDNVYVSYTTPNDSEYPRQWYLTKIEADEAWKYTRGSMDIIATVTEGVEWYHPDLYDRIWVNPGEDIDHDGVPMDPDDMNGLDDDGNGYVDDLIGWDFIEGLDSIVSPGEDGDVQDNNPDDFGGHGTHCSGIIGATTDNSIGIAGVVWSVKLMVLRCDYDTPERGYHEVGAQIQALQYAYEKGVDILSLSYGSDRSSSTAQYWTNKCYNNGALVFGAAGNENTSDLHYPSGWDFVIAVSAVDGGDRKTNFSNYGSWVDVSAPGKGIFSTWIDSTYAGHDGTSMATPIAAGVGALVMGFYPDSTRDFWEYRIMNGVDDINSLNPSYVGQLGEGRVNALKALFGHIWPRVNIVGQVLDYNSDNIVCPSETADVIITLDLFPDWQMANDMQVTIESYDSSVIILDSVYVFGLVFPGDVVDNALSPLKITVADGTAGHYSRLHIIAEAPSVGYKKRAVVKFAAGRPSFLVYECDPHEMHELYVLTSMDNGGMIYKYHDRENDGVIDSSVINALYPSMLVLTGDLDTNIFSVEEINVFKAAMDNGKNLIISGQYAPDFLALFDPEFLRDYFGAIHDQDAVSRMWGTSIIGISGDTVSDSMTLDCFSNASNAGNQISIGTSYATGTGIGFFEYQFDSTPDRFAAIRNQLSSGAKTMLFEFGLEGVSKNQSRKTDRDSLFASIVRWFGSKYVDIKESNNKANKPELIEIKASPNPFNASIELTVFCPESYTAFIMDMNGRRVKDFGYFNSSNSLKRITWFAVDNFSAKVTSGVYLFIVATDRAVHAKKIIFLK